MSELMSFFATLLAVAGLIMVATGCTVIGWVDDHAKEAGGEVGGRIAEVTVCPVDLVNCGHVYECAAPADNVLGHVEICVDDDDDITDVIAVYGDCVPTPRHEGLCIMKCPPDTGAGCNAFSGCYCPTENP